MESQAAPFVLVLESTVRGETSNGSGACEAFDKYFSLRVFLLPDCGYIDRGHMYEPVATDDYFAGMCHV